VIPGGSCWPAAAAAEGDGAFAWQSLQSNAIVNVSSPDEHPMHHTLAGRVRLLLPPTTTLPPPPAATVVVGWRSNASFAIQLSWLSPWPLMQL
jgi:hypothetical protein